MAMYLLVLIVLLNPAVSTDDDLGSMIVHPPESTIVYLNTEASFICEVNAPSANWNLNGRNINSLNNPDFDSTHNVTAQANVLCTLHIIAKEKYNGSLIQCVASESDGRYSRSQNATLLIQGPLATVGDLRVENDRTSILLSWSPPFSLDVTGVDPDVWYTVNISNVTDEDNTMEVPCANCHNLIHPSYTFTTANPSPSHKFSFTILSLNGAGPGNISEPVVGAFVEGVQPSPTSISTSSSDAGIQPSPTSTPTPSPGAGIHVLSSVLIIVFSLLVPIMCRFGIFTTVP